MTVMPDTPWWTNDVIEDIHYHHSAVCKELFGVDAKFAKPGHPLIDWLEPVRHLDAKTAFRKLIGEGVVLEAPPIPFAVEGNAPDDPNCLSDGSFNKPAAPE